VSEPHADGLTDGGPHADALAVLRGWTPPDPGQATLRDAFVAHLEARSDGTSRSCRPAHVTASALVVSQPTARVLLTLHPKVGRWLQTGGHCEATDPSLGAAALREAVEESGIRDLRLSAYPVSLDRHDVACGGAGMRSVHLDVQYVAFAPPGSVERRSAESLDLRWFSMGELPTPTDAALLRLVRRAAQLCTSAETSSVASPSKTSPSSASGSS
jgi:8-oxo-dGTP pyrophosphatase MutT (NUDIX family)